MFICANKIKKNIQHLHKTEKGSRSRRDEIYKPLAYLILLQIGKFVYLKNTIFTVGHSENKILAVQVEK